MTSSKKQLRRPMAFTRKVSLFQREIIEHIGPAAMDLLLSRARRISEGKLSGEGTYFGSTMLTIDLSKIEEVVTERCDIATAARLARQMDREPRMKGAIRSLALEEAERIARQPVQLVDLELRIRSEGEQIFIDIDMEGAAGALAAENGR